MKSHKCRIMALLCLAALLLAGCSKETNSGPGAMGSEVWEQWPNLTYGTIETEKLAVLPWNSGRCEATSYNQMAETENGYYLAYVNYLYYADKNDLGNWILVCNKPECTHYNEIACNARLGSYRIIVKDDRLYFPEDTGRNPHLFQSQGVGMILVNTAPDGTDKQLAYALEEALNWAEGSHSELLSQDQWLYARTDFNQDGSKTKDFFRITEDGVEEIPLPENNSENATIYEASEWFALFGEQYFHCPALSTEKLFRFKDDHLVGFDLSLVPAEGGCITGNTLRVFKENDGYYDINTETGKEVKVVDARLENSASIIMLPNCIIESTLLYCAIEDRTEGMTHAMEVFDGEFWRTVKLPEELQNAGKDDYVYVMGVTSDSILIAGRNMETYFSEENLSTLYRIPLDADELVMEYCGEIKQPTKNMEE